MATTLLGSVGLVSSILVCVLCAASRVSVNVVAAELLWGVSVHGFGFSSSSYHGQAQYYHFSQIFIGFPILVDRYTQLEGGNTSSCPEPESNILRIRCYLQYKFCLNNILKFS